MKEKKLIFIIGGLFIVLIVVWIIVLQPPKKNPQKTNTAAEESGLEFKILIEMVEELNNKEVVKELSYEENKDPFSLSERNVSGEEASASKVLKLSLKGILWDSQKPLAIINGEVVKEGGTIKGIKVKRIEPNYVVLEVEGEEELLFIEGVKIEGMKKEKGDKKIKTEGETDEKIAPIGIY